MRILIVEDDAALSSFICKGVEAEHHAVDVSNEGNQGPSMAMELDYDRLVLDLNLPGVDGLSALKSLRQRKANLPVMIPRHAAGLKTACNAKIRRKADCFLACLRNGPDTKPSTNSVFLPTVKEYNPAFPEVACEAWDSVDCSVYFTVADVCELGSKKCARAGHNH